MIEEKKIQDYKFFHSTRGQWKAVNETEVWKWNQLLDTDTPALTLFYGLTWALKDHLQKEGQDGKDLHWSEYFFKSLIWREMLPHYINRGGGTTRQNFN